MSLICHAAALSQISSGLCFRESFQFQHIDPMSRSAILVFAMLHFGFSLRSEHAPHDLDVEDMQGNGALLQSNSNVTGSDCCCWRPAAHKVYTNPFGAKCPVKGAKFPESERGCFRPAKPSPCSSGPHKHDMYCEWYHVLDCASSLRYPGDIMWNYAWKKIYENMS